MADNRLEIVLAAKDVASKTLRTFQGRIKSLTKNITSLQGSILALAGGYGMKQLASSAWDVAAGFEQMEAKLDVMTRGRGKQVLEEINALALDLPVSTQKAVDGFTTMVAMGLNPTIDELKTMIDVASILGDDVITRLALQLGQASSKGKLMAQDLNIMAEAGINARKYLKEAYGMSLADLQQSSIPIREQISVVFEGMLADFGGASERMKEAGRGLVATFKSYATEITRQFMEAGVYDAIKVEIAEVNTQMGDWLKNNDDLLAQRVPEYIDDLKASIEKVANTYEKYKDEIGVASYGLVGGLLFGKFGAAGMIGYKIGDIISDQLYEVEGVKEGLEKYADQLRGAINIWEAGDQPGKESRLEKLNAELETTIARLNILKGFAGGFADDFPAEMMMGLDQTGAAPTPEVTPEPGGVKSRVYSMRPGTYDAHVQTLQEYNEELAKSIRLQNAMALGIEDTYGVDVGEGSIALQMKAQNEEFQNMAKETEKEAIDWAMTMEDAFTGWASTYSSTLTDMVWESEITFGSIAESFGKMLLQMAIQAEMANLVGMITGKGSSEDSIIGAAISLIGGFIGGSTPTGKASGGYVYPGSTYLVGEKGPELLTMGGGGYITPNDRIGGGGNVQVIVNNNTPAQVEQREETIGDMRSIIIDVVEHESARNPAFLNRSRRW